MENSPLQRKFSSPPANFSKTVPLMSTMLNTVCDYFPKILNNLQKYGVRLQFFAFWIDSFVFLSVPREALKKHPDYPHIAAPKLPEQTTQRQTKGQTQILSLP